MFSPRGRGLIVGGIFLISVGLAFMGMATLTTMMPFLFGVNDGSLLGQLSGNQPLVGQSNSTEDQILNTFLGFFDIPYSIVEYCLFLGTIMLLAVISLKLSPHLM